MDEIVVHQYLWANYRCYYDFECPGVRLTDRRNLADVHYRENIGIHYSGSTIQNLHMDHLHLDCRNKIVRLHGYERNILNSYKYYLKN